MGQIGGTIVTTGKYNMATLKKHLGSVAEWSKALVLGTSLFGGVGSNPITAKHFKAHDMK